MKKEKVIRLEDRVPTIKIERRKKANKMLIIYILIFFLLALVILYFQSSFSKVKTIEVEGVRHITEEQIEKWSAVNIGSDFWGVSKEDVKNEVTGKSPYLKSIEVERKFPTTIVLKVKEWVQVGTLYDGETFKILLENGAVVESNSLESKNYEGPVFMNWDNPKQLKKLLEKFNKLPDSIIASISEVHHLEGKNGEPLVKLYMIEGYEVMASVRDFEKKMKLYPSIVEQLDPKKKGIIHLEVGAYFKEYEPVKEEIDQPKDEKKE